MTVWGGVGVTVWVTWFHGSPDVRVGECVDVDAGREWSVGLVL